MNRIGATRESVSDAIAREERRGSARSAGRSASTRVACPGSSAQNAQGASRRQNDDAVGRSRDSARRLRLRRRASSAACSRKSRMDPRYPRGRPPPPAPSPRRDGNDARAKPRLARAPRPRSSSSSSSSSSAACASAASAATRRCTRRGHGDRVTRGGADGGVVAREMPEGPPGFFLSAGGPAREERVRRGRARRRTPSSRRGGPRPRRGGPAPPGGARGAFAASTGRALLRSSRQSAVIRLVAFAATLASSAVRKPRSPRGRAESARR